MRLVKMNVTETPPIKPSVLIPRVDNQTKNYINPLQKIALPTMEGIDFENVQDIINLEAKGNYTALYFIDGRQALVCKTLREMEKSLKNNPQFIRIHRSFTINLNRIQRYIKGKGGYVIMEDGRSINVSCGKKQGFMDALQYHFR